MAAILCFGDSNVWGNIPGSFNAVTGLCSRHSKETRWTGVLQRELGKDFQVIEEGLNGRTTVVDEILPGRPYRNGLSQLLPCLESHYPLHLVIFMLGTNDTKIQYDRSVDDIAEGIRQLIRVVRNSNKGIQGCPPKVLLIAPQPMIRINILPETLNEHSIVKSEQLSVRYKQIAEEELCDFLDAASHVVSSPLDGIHLDEKNSELLGKIIAKKVISN